MNAVPSPKPSASQIWVVLLFFAFGLFAFLGGIRRLIVDPEVLVGHPYRLQVVGFAHCLGLGFLFSTVVGACYQLVPVALGNALFCRKSPYLHLVLHGVGMPLLVHGLLQANRTSIAAGAACAGLGIVIFVFNMTMTVCRPFRPAATSIGLLISFGFLVSAFALAGWMILARFGFVAPADLLAVVGVHAYAMVAGFFVTLLLSVTYTLLPMFLLTASPSPRWSLLSVSLYAAGVFVATFGSLVWAGSILPGAILAAVGAGCFGREIWECFRSRSRALDAGLRLFGTSFAFLPLAMAVGITRALWTGQGDVMLTARLDFVTFVLLAVGVLCGSILGMGGKIIPFLIWQKRYAPKIGQASVPKLAELTPPSLLKGVALLHPAGALTLALGATLQNTSVVQAGGILCGGAWLLFVAHGFCALRHLVRPRLTALAPRPTLTPKTTPTPSLT